MRDNCPFSRFWLDSRRSELKDEWRFGRFRIGLERRALWIDDERAKIGARAFDVLVALFERRQKIVSKGELLDLVWPGLAVEESNLHVQMSTLRKILGPGIIATVPGRGYRFVAALEDPPTDLLPQPVAEAASGLQDQRSQPNRSAVRPGSRPGDGASVAVAAPPRHDRRSRRHRQDATGAGGRARAVRQHTRRRLGRRAEFGGNGGTCRFGRCTCSR